MTDTTIENRTTMNKLRSKLWIPLAIAGGIASYFALWHFLPDGFSGKIPAFLALPFNMILDATDGGEQGWKIIYGILAFLIGAAIGGLVSPSDDDDEQEEQKQ